MKNDQVKENKNTGVQRDESQATSKVSDDVSLFPRQFRLRFEYLGGKVETLVVARSAMSARAYAPTGATNVGARAVRRRSCDGNAEL